jgi:hypothetical protein
MDGHDAKGRAPHITDMSTEFERPSDYRALIDKGTAMLSEAIAEAVREADKKKPAKGAWRASDDRLKRGAAYSRPPLDFLKYSTIPTACLKSSRSY